MKYNIIGYSDDLKVMGNYPQTAMKDNYNPRLSTSHWQVRPNEFPDFKPNYEIEFLGKANPTNYLHDDHTSFGMTVDAKFKSILEQFNLPPHRFYPIKVYNQNKELLEYYWFHYIIDIWDYVDLENSTAQIYKKFEFKVDEIIPIPDLKTIKKFEENLPFDKDLKINKLVFKGNYPKYDVIKIIDVEFMSRLISDNLMEKLNEAGMTGFETAPYDKIVSD